MLSLPAEFWGYLNPVVRDRLVNYYATDLVFADVQNTIAIAKALPDFAKRVEEISAILSYKDSIEWYDTVSPQVSSLVQREPTIRGMADQMAGKIISDYFSKVSDLVGGHDNLVWYATPSVLSAIDPLVNRSGSLREINDFIRSMTPGISPGVLRWNMLQTYLGDDWFTKVGWYTNDAVVGGLGNLISSGILPTIKEKATFQKAVDVLGPFNQTKNVGDYIRSRLEAFTMKISFSFTGEVGCNYSFDRTYAGLAGLRAWAGDVESATNGIFADPFCTIWDAVNALMILGKGISPFMNLLSDIVTRMQNAVPDGGWT